jgi:phosphoketolase
MNAQNLMDTARALVAADKGLLAKHGGDLPEIRNWKWGGKRKTSNSP